VLTPEQIDAALPLVAKGLRQYQWLQTEFGKNQESASDSTFRRRFNHFYRVRRSPAWQDIFFPLMAKAQRDTLQFNTVLEDLRVATGRVEASFASKLVATVDSTFPVIDKFVLENLGAALPTYASSNRAAQICVLHEELKAAFDVYLASEDGKYLVREFNRLYPSSGISEVKMLDLVLWQTRGKHKI